VRRESLFFHRDFRLLWLGDTVSQFGSIVTNTAAPLLAALVLAATPFQMGLLGAADTAAFLLVGLPAGAWVDRMRRRPLMLSADLGRAVLLASIPVAWWFGVLTLTQLILIGLAVGVLTVFFDVAYQSFLPVLVSRDKLMEGNSKLQASQSVAMVSGPAIGGWLTQLAGAANAIGLNALGFLWSASCLFRIRAVEPVVERGPDRNLRREIAEGLKFVFGNRSLVGIVGCTATANFSTSIISAVSVLVLTRQLGASAGIVGVLLAGGGIGGVVGALTASRIAKWIGQGRTIWVSMVVTVPFSVLVPLAGRGWLLSLFAIGWFANAFGAVVYNIAQVSFRQAICPDRLLGRMNASVRFMVWGTLPLGALVGGGLGALIGIHPTLWVGTVGVLLSPLPVLLSPLRRLRDLPSGVEETDVERETVV
jgi:predicted MFS family arabinose efflux permease